MKSQPKMFILVASLISLLFANSASADVQPGQSMTHMKTVQGLTSQLEALGVVFVVQGGATVGLIGDSLAESRSQIVFHIPITESKGSLKHKGSNLVMFNVTTDSKVQLKNPIINLKKGVVSATIPQASDKSVEVFVITNIGELRSKKSLDKQTRIRSTIYTGVALSLAPGISTTLASLLNLPENTFAEGAAFATADLTLKSVARR